MDDSSSVMDVSPDPVTLRAAALSTLKSKRRKPVPEKSIVMAPSRPTPTSDFQLDYGQEDVMTVDPLPPPPRKPSPKSTQTAPIIIKDVQMREEGEISDEEILRPAIDEEILRPAIDEEILRPAIPLKRSPPPPPPPRKSKSPIPAQAGAELDNTLSLLGPDRVRPGLLLTMDEYDTAKDIILDLLGWGVPPDFLVDCGLTKELVFYVFTELNLRLPDNFDSSGIIPYTPESSVQPQQSVLMPPPPIQETNRTVVDITLDVAPTVTTRLPTSASLDSPSNTDLHDMERQRRQELLARKAVQASRKLKQSASIETSLSISQSNSSNTDNQDVPMGDGISTEVIEDFLNSIGPVRDTEYPNGILPPPSDDDQGTDNAQLIVVPRRSPGSANTDDIVMLPLSHAQLHEPSLSFAEPPPTSVDSVASTFPQVSDANLMSPQLSLPREPSTHPRRGIRPLASDFVDFDPAPRGNESKSRLEPSPFSSGIIRRLNLAANFRDIGSRRCVIDLSDSEDDDEQEVKDQLQQSQSIVENQPSLKRDRRSKASNFRPPAPIKSSLSGSQSPAALKIKELEIRRMRELIAKREEETRLKKLASAKSSVNVDTTSDSPTLINHLPSFKQEDVDVVMNPDSAERNGFSNYRNSESATPPPRSVSKSPNDEDTNQDRPPNLGITLAYPHQDLASEAHEAREAQLVAMPEQAQHQQKQQHPTFGEGMVDADPEPSPSTQVNQKTMLAIPKQDANEPVSETSTAFNRNNSQQDGGKYRAYYSIFESYPLLRGYSRPISSDPGFSSDLSSLYMYPSTRTSSSMLAEPSSYFMSATSLPELNLKALKLATIGRVLYPLKQICRYEVPGGGTCRDVGCDEVHLSRLQGATVEPSDQDVAEYLFNTLPRGWLVQHQISSVSKIAAVLQQLHGYSSLEDLVDQALLTLGSRPT